MHVLEAIDQLRAQLKSARSEGKTVGLVPTMGYLHEGHLSLVQNARQSNDVVVVSVFVNPTQFGPNEDLDAYPRDTERDLNLLRGAGTDLAFFPSAEALYPDGFTTYVSLEGPMTATLCGRSRPNHFRGVATIVSKLFNIVEPDRAYFGQKDAQQVAVIEQMTRDLDFDIEIVACPTVREPDGLAMSSRNTYLSEAERAQAPLISKALFGARELIEKGERNSSVLLDYLKRSIRQIDGAVIDYVSIVDSRSLGRSGSLAGKGVDRCGRQSGPHALDR